MTDTEKNIRNEFIKELINKFGNDRSILLQVLQEFQKKFNYIDEHSQQEIAKAMNIHPVEVGSIISFYSFLYDKPRGKHIVRLCKNIVCEFHGSKNLAESLKENLKLNSGGTTDDGNITLELVNCFGLCDKSPSMVVDEEVYENLDNQKALNIIRGLK